MLRRDAVVFLSTSKQLQKNSLKIVYVVRRDKFLKSMLHQLDLEYLLLWQTVEYDFIFPAVSNAPGLVGLPVLLET